MRGCHDRRLRPLGARHHEVSCKLANNAATVAATLGRPLPDLEQQGREHHAHRDGELEAAEMPAGARRATLDGVQALGPLESACACFACFHVKEECTDRALPRAMALPWAPERISYCRALRPPEDAVCSRAPRTQGVITLTARTAT